MEQTEGRDLSCDEPLDTENIEEIGLKPSATHNTTASRTRASTCKEDLTAAFQDDDNGDEVEYCSAEEDNEPDESECSTTACKLVNSDLILFEAKNESISSALPEEQNQKQDEDDIAIQEVPIGDLQVINDREDDLPVETIVILSTQVPLSHATSSPELSEEVPSVPFLTAPEIPKKQSENDFTLHEAQLEELELMNDRESNTPMVSQSELSASTIKVPSAGVPLPHIPSEIESTKPLPMTLVPFEDVLWEPITSTTESLECVPLTSPSVSSKDVPSAPLAPIIPLMPDLRLEETVLTSLSSQEYEEQELHLALDQQKAAFDLYCQYLQNALEEDALPHNVEELHEIYFDRAIQSYEACTRGNGYESIEIGREILVENLEKYFKQLKEAAQNRLEVFKMSMSDQMGKIYSEVIFQFRLQFSETAYDTEKITELEDAYALAMGETMNTFYSITTDMQESTNVPRRLLFSEMGSFFKNLKAKMCTKLLNNAEQNAMDTFKLIYTTERDNFTGDVNRSMLEEMTESALTKALAGFEKDTSDLNSMAVNQYRCRLEKDLDSARRKVIESYVVTERLRIFQSHQRYLTNSDLTTQENLLLQHSEALAAGISTLRQRTIGFPTHLVNSECVLLQQDMKQELNERLLHLTKLLETKILSSAKNEAREMFAAVFETDENSVKNDEVGTLAIELSALREKHEDALSVALASFDRLTFEIDSIICDAARKELQEEFQLKLNNTLKRTEDHVSVSQFEAAVVKARNLYMSIFSEESLEDISADVAENTHVLALTSALSIFDQLTADLRETETTLRRAQLIESLENIYREAMTHQRNQQLDMAEKGALEKFTADLKLAVRDSDTWARQKQKAQESALQQFDQDTSYFSSATSSHRDRLKRGMDSFLNVIQNVYESVGGDGVCCICLTERSNTAFQPCGHRCCSICAPQLAVCPTCRSRINGTLRIY